MDGSVVKPEGVEYSSYAMDGSVVKPDGVEYSSNAVVYEAVVVSSSLSVFFSIFIRHETVAIEPLPAWNTFQLMSVTRLLCDGSIVTMSVS